MGEKVVINGRDYTERAIDSMVIDGQSIAGNLIEKEYGEEGRLVNLDINVKSLEAQSLGNDIKIESFDVNNLSMENTPAQKSLREESKKETVRSRIIKSIIRFLNKFIY